MKNLVRICALLRKNSIFPVIEIAKQARFWARIKLFIMEEYGYNNTTTQWITMKFWLVEC